MPKPAPIRPVFNIQPFIPPSSYQPHQLAINAPTAWELGFSGQNTIIAVIDSGINVTHSDFIEQSSTLLIDTINATGFRLNESNNTVYKVTDYQDTDGHGTAVSSIASGQQYGIAPSSAILPIKVFFDPEVSSIVIDTAIPYAAARSDIINASMSGMVNPLSSGYLNSYSLYRSSLINNNVVLIAAAGNGNQPIGGNHFELNNQSKNLSIDTGLTNKVLNVVSVDSGGRRSSFSNYPGSCADVSFSADISCNSSVMEQIQSNFIAAPGEAIIVASHANSTSSNTVGGTSMSTSVVSGSVALLLSAWDQLKSDEAVAILKTTADRSFAWYSPEEYGVGLVDIAAAMTPIGELKATASENELSTEAYLKPTNSTANLPASLSALKTLSALKRVAYFDDYNRDFAVDMTRNIQIQKTPINWVNHWQQTALNSRYTQSIPVGKKGASSPHQFSITYNSNTQNAQTVQRPFKQLSLTGEQYALHFGAQNFVRAPLDNIAINSATNSMQFIKDNNPSLIGDTFTMQFKISPSMSLMADARWANSYAPNTPSRTFDTASQLGLAYQVSPQFTIGLGVELHQEHNALADLKGEGTFSFGQTNRTQLSVLSANYQTAHTQFYGLVKIGQLTHSQTAKASYITLKNATLGQSLLGVKHQLNPNTHIGLQAYKTLGITSANLQLDIPVGMDQNGNTQIATETFQTQNSLLPNTLEMFYRVSPSKGLNYTLNAITGEHDSGLGITLNRRF